MEGQRTWLADYCLSHGIHVYNTKARHFETNLSIVIDTDKIFMYSVHSQKCNLFLHDLVKLAASDL